MFFLVVFIWRGQSGISCCIREVSPSSHPLSLLVSAFCRDYGKEDSLFMEHYFQWYFNGETANLSPRNLAALAIIMKEEFFCFLQSWGAGLLQKKGKNYFFCSKSFHIWFPRFAVSRILLGLKWPITFELWPYSEHLETKTGTITFDKSSSLKKNNNPKWKSSQMISP